jgi:hypothetical protein
MADDTTFIATKRFCDRLTAFANSEAMGQRDRAALGTLAARLRPLSRTKPSERERWLVFGESSAHFEERVPNPLPGMTLLLLKAPSLFGAFLTLDTKGTVVVEDVFEMADRGDVETRLRKELASRHTILVPATGGRRLTAKGRRKPRRPEADE